MPAKSILRTAYTVECFLNSLRLKDGPERTQLEENLVYWLADSTRQKSDCLIYQNGIVGCYSNNRMLKSFEVPDAQQSQTIWCNPAKLSAIDAQSYARNGALVMLGTAGLLLTLPGSAAAQQAMGGSNLGAGMSSNNNNNNNNNNG